MAKRGKGRMSRDLPRHSAAELSEVMTWLGERLLQLEAGWRRCAEAYQLTRRKSMLTNAKYYKHAVRACRWVIAQLNYVLKARAHQEQGENHGARGHAKVG